MSATAAHGRQGRAGTLLSIGQVLARLNGEFPELSNSKLRFLEEQGLVNPSRTKSGYRKFSDNDVERLKLILSLQRDRYLPLKVIRSYLADLDSGLAPAIPGIVSGAETGSVTVVQRTTRDEIIRSTGASAVLLTEAISAGIIPAGDTFDEDAVTMMRAVVFLHRVGIDPRHLRGYRHMAEREAALVESAVLPLVRRGDSAGRARANELAGEIAHNLDHVRGMLIRQAHARGQA